MNIQRVRAYLAEIDRLRRVSGSTTEQIVRDAFQSLLRDWSKAKGLVFLPEQAIGTGPGRGRRPDGTIRHDIRVPHGYWEAKDEDDDLDREIETKRRAGYPVTNTIFEDTRAAILWQHGREVLRCDMRDPQALTALLTAFFAYEPPVIEDWRQAVRQFQRDLPAILDALRARIAAAHGNADFNDKARAFLDLARKTVNPKLGDADIREMLIQHILTEEIFTSVFRSDFHRENNIARMLYELERLFLRGSTKQDLLRALEPYYAAIKKAALDIDSHAEKQTFLKVIYESFYKTYNPKAADRLGVIYTPNEIVRFMIRGADWLCREHFGRDLIDEGVEILDPATGTGTFICELLQHFAGQDGLRRKYKQELHANEVAILPYYVANLNIEATYAEITGQFAEFDNLVFADTLDMTEGLGIRRGQTPDLFGSISAENAERYNRQNRRKISVVIGNPPYNANQQNENDNNKNREYRHVDERIKATFVKLSTAQKTKVYDMYARFYRWAFDRVHDDGVVAFVTNRSFVESRTFDGFRRYVGAEYGDIVVVDLGGDVRANPKLSGTTHNVFGIQTGVAICFFIKGGKGAGIRYARRPEDETARAKLDWLGSTHPADLTYERVTPSERADWIGLPENDWDDLLPVADKKTKAAKVKGQERAVFKLFSNGTVTARDEWVTGKTEVGAITRSKEFSTRYESEVSRWKSTRKDNQKGRKTEENVSNFVKRNIKWTSELERRLMRGDKIDFEASKVRSYAYRPFINIWGYYDSLVVHRLYQQANIFPTSGFWDNIVIGISGLSSSKPFQIMAENSVPSYDLLEKTQCLPRHRYTPTGERIDNVTDWALNKFVARYGKRAGVTKDAIFHYVYAALHDPVWRETYAVNLKRDFPRIPFHDDFAQWAAWGETLMALHTGYENVAPWDVTRTDTPDTRSRAAGVRLPVKLKSHPAEGRIDIDSETVLTGFPPRAWDYRLGNRAGLDWVLDQHREKKVRDATVEAWLADNPEHRYRFADHKDRVIDLLARVARVSVETLEIVDAMRAVVRPQD